MRREKPPLLIAQTQPGFEAIAAGEIAGRIEGATVRGTRTVGDKNGMGLFDYAGDGRDLFALRTVEDLFVVVAELPDVPPTREGLRALEAAAGAAGVEAALNLARRVAPGRGGTGGCVSGSWPGRWGGRPTGARMRRGPWSRGSRREGTIAGV